MEKQEIKILPGLTYHNGKSRRRTVLGFSGYFVMYKTPSSKRNVTGIPIWEFKKWAKGIVEDDSSDRT